MRLQSRLRSTPSISQTTLGIQYFVFYSIEIHEDFTYMDIQIIFAFLESHFGHTVEDGQDGKRRGYLINLRQRGGALEQGRGALKKRMNSRNSQDTFSLDISESA